MSRVPVHFCEPSVGEFLHKSIDVRERSGGAPAPKVAVSHETSRFFRRLLGFMTPWLPCILQGRLGSVGVSPGDAGVAVFSATGGMWHISLPELCAEISSQAFPSFYSLDSYRGNGDFYIPLCAEVCILGLCRRGPRVVLNLLHKTRPSGLLVSKVDRCDPRVRKIRAATTFANVATAAHDPACAMCVVT